MHKYQIITIGFIPVPRFVSNTLNSKKAGERTERQQETIERFEFSSEATDGSFARNGQSNHSLQDGQEATSVDEPNQEQIPCLAGAADVYLEEVRENSDQSTCPAYESRLKDLLDWCDDHGVTTLTALSAEQIREYKQYKVHELESSTLQSLISVIRGFLRYWQEHIKTVNLKPAITMLDTSAKTSTFSSEELQNIRDYLKEYRYATRTHALVEVLYHTHIGVSAARQLDVGDVWEDDSLLIVPCDGRTTAEHSASTAVKGLNEYTCQVLSDYCSERRISVRDDEGRQPLYSTQHGRAAESTLRAAVYGVSRPCYISGDCPHLEDDDIPDCDAAQNKDEASECPSSVSPQEIIDCSQSELINEVSD